MKTATLLAELASTWEVMAEMETESKPGRRETLRECVDGLRMLGELIQKAEATIAANPKTLREAALEELLRSACAIANRQGAATAWERFLESAKQLGINGITARTYRVLPSDLEA